MSLNNEEFENVRRDRDEDEPLDGRDSQPGEGTSDDVRSLETDDPLRGGSAVLEENDRDPLGLNPETLQLEPLDEQRSIYDVDSEDDPGIDAERGAGSPDRRESPDTE
ncbi:hypothetical protein AUR04nite_05630 [Glutamicibacter uratoxydans]|uniref:DUF5709 domain-containing protein n=1 Tax=Glutamicibacter uratoxydans TaxID=43667 RepID=A0A4Y4DRA2_GLUUR|nr:hypothetical protein [Glutamicibacter uratoxydans]GED05031.1 hypothetical protein AUR04nite_05630 [Glutamicibacter uratoxydans]